MSRTHDITISAFDLDRLESQLDGAISELSDAKVTAEFWIGQAEKADQAAADLKAELADTRREWKEELAAERALADRLADALEGIWPFLEEDIPHGCNSTAYMNSIELCRANITAWKEARSES